MKFKKPSACWQKSGQRGISLLELMVALAIGLILLLALATLMMVANRSSMNRSTAELLDETARQVFSRLEIDFRQAGYVDPFASNLTIDEAFNLKDANRLARYLRQKDYLLSADKKQLTLLGQLSKGKVQPVIGCSGELSDDGQTCAAVAGSTWHSIQIAYQVASLDTANDLASTSTVAGENKTDSNALMGCVSREATADKPIIVNRYYFKAPDNSANVTAARNLRCNTQIANFDDGIDGTSRTEDPIVEGVEQMVFRYLVTPSDETAKAKKIDFSKLVSGRSVTKYLSAEEVANEDLGWANVVGVEVCLIVAVQPLDGRRDFTRSGVQPQVPTCLREEGTAADTAFKPNVNRPTTWQDHREYRRYVRTFSLPGSLYLPSINI